MIPTPYYIVYENKLRSNLSLLKDVANRADVKIIMAFKANALWKTFPIISEYFQASTASSVYEMRLSLDYLGNDVHAYSPAYTPETFPQFLEGCTHITFNSLSQYTKFKEDLEIYNSRQREGKRVSAGLRINPKCSVIETDIYNPCIPGSRFGIDAEALKEGLPEGIEGLHFHALCECDSRDLEKVLNVVEAKFGHLLPKIKWLNMGGGHLITRKDYNIDLFVKLMRDLHQRYPDLEIILEPGSAFTWQTGDLVTSVVDVVEDAGIKTAIIDASFACHAPDCLEMPYRPNIAEAAPDDDPNAMEYRLGGNSCLSGDFVSSWKFPQELKPGDILTLMDMNHYTTVKTNMFNGIAHPSIWLQPENGAPILLREYSYEDYRDRMS